jgi:enediyne biosynthesis protein E3
MPVSLGWFLSRSENFVSFTPPGVPKTAVQPVAGRMVENGFRMALEDSRFKVLLPRLDAIELDLRGFAYEGAGLGLMILDCLLPWQNRLMALVKGHGVPYTYPLHVGAGLALAKLNKSPGRYFAHFDPFWCWQIMDGYGFYQSVFLGRNAFEDKALPDHESDYVRSIFDMGLGRGLWFKARGDAHNLIATLASFPPARQINLWTGVGFACSYAGFIQERTLLEALQKVAGPYRPQLALAAAIAAGNRQRFGNHAAHTDLACQVFCRLSGEEAATIANDALQGLPEKTADPAHKLWRERVKAGLLAAQGKHEQDNRVDIPQ